MPGEAFFAIYEIAADQAGYLTVAQAREAGVDPMALVMMERRENFMVSGCGFQAVDSARLLRMLRVCKSAAGGRTPELFVFLFCSNPGTVNNGQKSTKGLAAGAGQWFSASGAHESITSISGRDQKPGTDFIGHRQARAMGPAQDIAAARRFLGMLPVPCGEDTVLPCR